MRIICPSCSALYNVPQDALGSGCTARCAQCGTAWFAEPPHERGASEVAVLGPNAAEVLPYRPGGERCAPCDPELPVSGRRAVDLDAAARAARPVILEEGRACLLAPIDVNPRSHASRENSFSPAQRGLSGRKEPRAWRRAKTIQLWAHAAGLLALLAAAAVLMHWREAVVRLLPQSAPAYAAIGLPVNTRGVVFENVRTKLETRQSGRVLLAEGKLSNTRDRTVAVPRLRFALRKRDGVEVYVWTAAAPAAKLPGRGALSFSTEVADPPTDAHDVFVRFVKGGDLD